MSWRQPGSDLQHRHVRINHDRPVGVTRVSPSTSAVARSGRSNGSWWIGGISATLVAWAQPNGNSANPNSAHSGLVEVGGDLDLPGVLAPGPRGRRADSASRPRCASSERTAPRKSAEPGDSATTDALTAYAGGERIRSGQRAPGNSPVRRCGRRRPAAGRARPPIPRASRPCGSCR